MLKVTNYGTGDTFRVRAIGDETVYFTGEWSDLVWYFGNMMDLSDFLTEIQKLGSNYSGSFTEKYTKGSKESETVCNFKNNDNVSYSESFSDEEDRGRSLRSLLGTDRIITKQT